MTSTVAEQNNGTQPVFTPVDETARLQAENAQLREELRRERETAIRNLADFANYHRRTKRERTQAV